MLFAFAIQAVLRIITIHSNNESSFWIINQTNIYIDGSKLSIFSPTSSEFILHNNEERITLNIYLFKFLIIIFIVEKKRKFIFFLIQRKRLTIKKNRSFFFSATVLICMNLWLRIKNVT